MAQQDLNFPTEGLNLMGEFITQPPGTTPVGVNVQAFDALANRRRGGSRPGISKYNSATLNGPNVIQMLNVIVDPTILATLPDTPDDPSIPTVSDPTEPARNPNGRKVRVGGSGVGVSAKKPGPPVARDDTLTIQPGAAPESVNVIANDTYLGTAGIEIVSGPSLADASAIVVANTIEYTPPSDTTVSGTDLVLYRLRSSGNVGSSTARLVVTVRPSAFKYQEQGTASGSSSIADPDAVVNVSFAAVTLKAGDVILIGVAKWDPLSEGCPLIPTAIADDAGTVYTKIADLSLGATVPARMTAWKGLVTADYTGFLGIHVAVNPLPGGQTVKMGMVATIYRGQPVVDPAGPVVATGTGAVTAGLAFSPGAVPVSAGGSLVWAYSFALAPANNSAPFFQRQDAASRLTAASDVGTPEYRLSTEQLGPHIIQGDGGLVMDVTPVPAGTCTPTLTFADGADAFTYYWAAVGVALNP